VDDTDQLLKTVEVLSRYISDGHLTIFKFTTNYSAHFGTLAKDEDIRALPGFPSLKECLIALIKKVVSS
jgi:hypothetical protein